MVAATDGSNAQKLGLTAGLVVQELGWDEDTDDELRADIEDAIDAGFTPLFEWCSRRSKIVVDYPEDQLVLTGLVTADFTVPRGMQTRILTDIGAPVTP